MTGRDVLAIATLKGDGGGQPQANCSLVLSVSACQSARLFILRMGAVALLEKPSNDYLRQCPRYPY